MADDDLKNPDVEADAWIFHDETEVPLAHARGTNPSTARIYQYIEGHPGCSVAEIVSAVIDGGWIPQGAANRRYAKNLNKVRERGERVHNRPNTLGPATPANVDPHKAVRHMVVHCLYEGRGAGWCVRDDDGRYTVGRPLRLFGSRAEIAAVTVEEARSDTLRRHLLMAVRRYGHDELRRPRVVPPDIKRLLADWAESTDAEYMERRIAADA